MIAAVLICGTTLTSCFKDEPLNAECDIEQAYIHVDNPELMFLKANDTLVTLSSIQNEIKFTVKRGTDLSAIAPCFRMTPGATISPLSGSVQDFTNGIVKYTVTSEDKNWSRDYHVSFDFPPVVLSDINYDFSKTEKNSNKPANKYFVWYDINKQKNEH